MEKARTHPDHIVSDFPASSSFMFSATVQQAFARTEPFVFAVRIRRGQGNRHFRMPWLIVVVILATTLHGSAKPSVGQEQTPLVGLRAQIPADFFSPAKGSARTLERLQRDFDIYSWETFIAINWPTHPDGTVDKEATIGQLDRGGDYTPQSNGDYPTFWESWAPVQIAFPKQGDPSDWSTVTNPQLRNEEGWTDLLPVDRKQGESIDPDTIVLNADGAPSGVTVKDAYRSGQYRFINKFGKMHTWFADEQALDSGPLIDSNGRYVRYEIVLNEYAYEHIRKERLYTIAGQEAYAAKHSKHIRFPPGSFRLNGSEPELDAAVGGSRPISDQTKVGAIIIKAAWKELSDKDDSGKFHTRKMLVYTPKDAKNNSRQARFEFMHLGLVGMHIVHKSADVSQWTWSTFEHVDNCPDIDDVYRLSRPPSEPDRAYSFFNPKYFREKPFEEAMLSVNRPAARPWTPGGKEEEPFHRRTQVVRLTPLTQSTKDLNKDFQDLLKAKNDKSVWQHYQLVSTQWPTRPAGLLKSNSEREEGDVPELKETDVLGGPAPPFLANSVLETYIQRNVPNTSSSCMECHNNALSKSGHFSDFTFILERAQR